MQQSNTSMARPSGKNSATEFQRQLRIVAGQDANISLCGLSADIEQLATCVEQLAQTNLHRPVCAEHLACCCLALASQMLRVRKKNVSYSVWPTSLAMLCFRANRGSGSRQYPVRAACQSGFAECPRRTFHVGAFVF